MIILYEIYKIVIYQVFFVNHAVENTVLIYIFEVKMTSIAFLVLALDIKDYVGSQKYQRILLMLNT